MITIELPWPSADLSPNGRPGMWKHISAKKKAKNYAWGITKEVMGALGIRPGSVSGEIDVQLVFHPAVDRNRDLDNMQASMKASLDGISLALGVDDATFRPVSLMGDKRSAACVLITLKPSVAVIEHRGEIK